MDFGPWINAELDELNRSMHHEAGHIEYARHIDPEVSFTFKIKGGEGEAIIDLEGFEVSDKYGVAVAGCLAEGKIVAGGGQIDTDNASVNTLAAAIRNGLIAEPVAFAVTIPVAGNEAPSTCNKKDFQWLNGAPPNLGAIRMAIVAVADFLNNAANWTRVRRRAWSGFVVRKPGD